MKRCSLSAHSDRAVVIFSACFLFCFFAVCSIEFPMILRDSLEVLYLNDNQLDYVPQSVCDLHNLTELYLSKLVSPSVCKPPRLIIPCYG